MRSSTEELDALRKAAARSGRSIAELVRGAIRKVVLKPQTADPAAIGDGEPLLNETESLASQPRILKTDDQRLLLPSVPIARENAYNARDLDKGAQDASDRLHPCAVPH